MIVRMYRKMYTTLFNAVTEALELMAKAQYRRRGRPEESPAGDGADFHLLGGAGRLTAPCSAGAPRPGAGP